MMRRLEDNGKDDIESLERPSFTWKTSLFHLLALLGLTLTFFVSYKLAYAAYVPLANSLFQDLIENWKARPLIDIRTDLNPCE